MEAKVSARTTATGENSGIIDVGVEVGFGCVFSSGVEVGVGAGVFEGLGNGGASCDTTPAG